MYMHLNSEVCAVGVPVHGDLSHREEVFLADFLARRHLYEHDSCRCLPRLLPWNVCGDDVLGRRPLELLDACHAAPLVSVFVLLY